MEDDGAGMGMGGGSGSGSGSGSGAPPVPHESKPGVCIGCDTQFFTSATTIVCMRCKGVFCCYKCANVHAHLMPIMANPNAPPVATCDTCYHKRAAIRKTQSAFRGAPADLAPVDMVSCKTCVRMFPQTADYTCDYCQAGHCSQQCATQRMELVHSRSAVREEPRWLCFECLEQSRNKRRRPRGFAPGDDDNDPM